MRKRVTLFILWMLLVIQTFAQSDSLRIYSMQDVNLQNSWLSGSNPVGISFNRFRSFSVAEAGYRFEKGNFGNISLPASSDRYSVFAESFQTIGKVSLYGKIGYLNHQKRDLNWNSMTRNYWYGINLCDSISGNQHSETYELSGAFSLPVSAHWLIGTSFDYQVELTAKDVDPRNKNQWMDWQITPGLVYLRDYHKIGMSLLYGSVKESVDYQNIGAHSSELYFISYPLGYYKTLPQGENLKWYYSANKYGGYLQEEGTYGRFRLFQEAGGHISRQEVVSDRIRDRKEGITDTWQINYKGKGVLLSTSNRHEWSWKILFDRADSYEPLQQQDQSGVWHDYGQVLRSASRLNEYNLAYGFYRLRDTWDTSYSIVSGLDLKQTKNQLFFYPIEYQQSVHRITVYSTYSRILLLPEARLNLSFGFEYGKGGGSMICEKKLQSEQGTPEIKLWQKSDRLRQEYDYLTEPRLGLTMSVTYTRTFPFTWFVRLGGKLENAPHLPINSNEENIFIQFGLLF